MQQKSNKKSIGPSITTSLKILREFYVHIHYPYFAEIQQHLMPPLNGFSKNIKEN